MARVNLHSHSTFCQMCDKDGGRFGKLEASEGNFALFVIYFFPGLNSRSKRSHGLRKSSLLMPCPDSVIRNAESEAVASEMCRGRQAQWASGGAIQQVVFPCIQNSVLNTTKDNSSWIPSPVPLRATWWLSLTPLQFSHAPVVRTFVT